MNSGRLHIHSCQTLMKFERATDLYA